MDMCPSAAFPRIKEHYLKMSKGTSGKGCFISAFSVPVVILLSLRGSWEICISAPVIFLIFVTADSNPRFSHCNDDSGHLRMYPPALKIPLMIMKKEKGNSHHFQVGNSAVPRCTYFSDRSRWPILVRFFDYFILYPSLYFIPFTLPSLSRASLFNQHGHPMVSRCSSFSRGAASTAGAALGEHFTPVSLYSIPVTPPSLSRCSFSTSAALTLPWCSSFW